MKHTSKQFKPLVILPLLLMSLSACSFYKSKSSKDSKQDRENDEPIQFSLSSHLTQFSKCEDVEAEIKDYLISEAKRIYSDLDHGGPVVGEPRILNREVVLDDMVAETAADSSTSVPDEFTGTNNQVDQVQEGDRVKTNGTHIFQIAGNEIQIVKSFPADSMELVHTLKADGDAFQLFLDQDTLIVLSRENRYNDDEPLLRARASVIRPTSKTLVSTYDISDLSDPKKLDTYKLDGYIYPGSTRRIDQSIRIVTSQGLRYNFYRNFPEIYKASSVQLRKLMIENKLATIISEIEASSLEDFIGDHKEGCGNIYAPSSNYELGLTHISTINLAEKTVEKATILSKANQFYSSKKSLYLAYKSYRWLWQSEALDDFTYIYKFDIEDSSSAKFVSGGRIEGRILNQFAMDEHEDVLRVASTVVRRDEQQRQTYNHIVTLKEQVNDEGERELVELGRTKDLAPGETIRSARFNKGFGYIVTFRQVDPLYTVDLSDPENPEVMGELKIPGFSSYIHMLGEDHLLAIGPQGDDEGLTGGYKITVFDVSDKSNPIIALDEEGQKIEHDLDKNLWTSANWDHKAFTYFAAHSYLALPVVNYHRGSSSSRLQVFKISTDKKIKEVGEIDMSDVGSQPSNHSWYRSPAVERSMFVSSEGKVFAYALSHKGARSGLIKDDAIEVLSTVEYPGDERIYEPIQVD